MIFLKRINDRPHYHLVNTDLPPWPSISTTNPHIWPPFEIYLGLWPTNAESNWAYDSDVMLLRQILVCLKSHVFQGLVEFYKQGDHVKLKLSPRHQQWGGGLISDCNHWLLNSQQKWQDSTSFQALRNYSIFMISVYLEHAFLWRLHFSFSQLALPLSSAEKVDKQECDTNRELLVLSSPLCLQTGTEDWRKGGNRRNSMQKKGKWKKMEQIIYEQAFKEHRVTSNNKWKAKSIWSELHCFKTCLELKAASQWGKQ